MVDCGQHVKSFHLVFEMIAHSHAGFFSQGRIFLYHYRKVKVSIEAEAVNK